MMDRDSKSFPTLAIADRLGVPPRVAYALSWAIVLVSRGEPLGHHEIVAFSQVPGTIMAAFIRRRRDTFVEAGLISRPPSIGALLRHVPPYGFDSAQA